MKISRLGLETLLVLVALGLASRVGLSSAPEPARARWSAALWRPERLEAGAWRPLARVDEGSPGRRAARQAAGKPRRELARHQLESAEAESGPRRADENVLSHEHVIFDSPASGWRTGAETNLVSRNFVLFQAAAAAAAKASEGEFRWFERPIGGFEMK